MGSRNGDTFWRLAHNRAPGMPLPGGQLREDHDACALAADASRKVAQVAKKTTPVRRELIGRGNLIVAAES